MKFIKIVIYFKRNKFYLYFNYNVKLTEHKNIKLIVVFYLFFN